MRERHQPRLGELLEEAPNGDVWPICKHPKTPANTQHIGKGGDRCRICRRKIAREYQRRQRGFYRMR